MSASGRERVPRAALRALGTREPPREVRFADGAELVLEEVLQHGFFAATARYRASSGPMLVKFGRSASLLGLPLAWLGRCLTRRELALYARCAGIPGVPGRFEALGPNAFARPFVAGHPLERGERVDDEFFPRLEALVSAIHARRIALVDLQKCANVLVDADGRPQLFDFQAAWHWPERGERRGLARLVPNALGQFLLERLQRGDRFHVLKHWRRCRPDTISPEALESTHHPGRLGYLHRAFHGRWRALRRKLGF